MGNYISIIIGCVGAVEFVTFLHQITLRAELEHDHEAMLIADRSSTQPIRNSGVNERRPAEVARAPPREELGVPKATLKSEVHEPTVQKVERSTSNLESAPPPVPAIRFEVYERSNSVPDAAHLPVVESGLQYRPLIRDSSRRKAIKKRNSSGSIDSKLSREEELRAFTSLEEEEFSSIGEDFVPISYGASDDEQLQSESAMATMSTPTTPTTQTQRHHRRHLKSPVNEAKVRQSGDGGGGGDESPASRDESGDFVLYEERAADPWGDIKPDHHRSKDRALWDREKAMSIEELQEDEDKVVCTEDGGASRTTATANATAEPNANDLLHQQPNNEYEQKSIDNDDNRVSSNQIIVRIESGPESPQPPPLALDRGVPTLDRPDATETLQSADGGERVAKLYIDTEDYEEDLELEKSDEYEEEEDDDDLTPVQEDDEQLSELRVEDWLMHGQAAQVAIDYNNELTLSSACEEEEEEEEEEDTHSHDASAVIEDDGNSSAASESFPSSDRLDNIDTVHGQQQAELTTSLTLTPGDESQSFSFITLEQCQPDPMESKEINAAFIAQERWESDAGSSRKISAISECNSTVRNVTPVSSVFDAERPKDDHFVVNVEMDYEAHVPSPVSPNVDGVIIIEEDISDYNDFVSVLKRNVAKDSKYPNAFQFPLQPENLRGRFPKEMSDTYTFDDGETATLEETPQFKLRRRENSIKDKIHRQNRDAHTKSGHHSRYNLPRYSVDMSVRLEISNRLFAEELKYFPLRPVNNVAGQFPTYEQQKQQQLPLQSRRNNGAAAGAAVGPVPVVSIDDGGGSNSRKVIDMPKISLMVIDEEQTTSAAAATTTLVNEDPNLRHDDDDDDNDVEDVSVDAAPAGLQSPRILVRSRSSSPFIVDRLDPLMMLLGDSMSLPL